MRWYPLIVTGALLAAGASGASGMGLGDAAELEHARANARAGGPLSDRDAELLNRYGCLSGTENTFCQQQDRERQPRNHHRRKPER